MFQEEGFSSSLHHCKICSC